MSKATKRKHVTKEVLEEYYVPEDGEVIVKLTGGRGNNLHEVETADGSKYLVSMPTKFRKNVWVKRGDFVIISPIKEGNKVKGEIVYILYAKQIKYLKKENLWPVNFEDTAKTVTTETISSDLNTSRNQGQPVGAVLSNNNDLDASTLNSESKSESLDGESDENSSEEEDDELFQNPNHRPVYYYDEDSSSDDEETDEDDEANDSSELGRDVNSVKDAVRNLDLKK